jgi:hypothetical protein
MEDFLDSLWGSVIATFLFIGIMLSGIFVGVRQLDHHYAVPNCRKQSVAYQRETKFVDYNYWSYECLVKTNNGTYVNINNLINNVQD